MIFRFAITTYYPKLKVFYFSDRLLVSRKFNYRTQYLGRISSACMVQ
jgi:hypothetical protein